jgi:hypothetical protein
MVAGVSLASAKNRTIFFKSKPIKMQDATVKTFRSERLEVSIERLKHLRSMRLDLTLALNKCKVIDGIVIIPGVKLQDGRVVSLELAPTGNAYQQLCSRLKLPMNYLNTLYSSLPPKNTHEQDVDNTVRIFLGDQNLQTLLSLDKKGAFVRAYIEKDDTMSTLSGTLRAVLSDRYFPIENLDIAIQVLASAKKVSEERGLKINVDECSLSEDVFYMRFSCPDVQAYAHEALKNYRIPDDFESGGGTGVVSGFVVKNSETGNGALTIAPMVTVMKCRNRMVWQQESQKRRHLGAKLEEGQTWSADTQHKNSELIIAQIKDIVDQVLSEDFILKRVNDIEEMHKVKLENPVEVVRSVCKAVNLDSDETDDVLNFFCNQGSAKSAFDVCQAFTYFAQQDGISIDKRFELECMAFDMGNIAKGYDVAPRLKPSDN